MTSRYVALLALLVAIGAGLVWLSTDRQEVDAGNGDGDEGAAEADGATLQTNSGGSHADPDPDGAAPAPIEKSRPLTWQELKALVSTPVDRDWALLRVGQDDGSRPLDVSRVVEQMAGSLYVTKPPYHLAFCLGNSDLPWLEAWKRSFDAELDDLRTESEPLEAGDVVPVQQRYRDLLTEIVAQRFAEDPIWRERMRDGRTLSQIQDPGHRQWLETIVDAAVSPLIWTFSPVLVNSDRSLLSAVDLAEGKALSMRIAEVMRHVPPSGPSKKEEAEIRELVRDFEDRLVQRRN